MSLEAGIKFQYGFNLRKHFSLNLHFTSKTAGCGTDLVKDSFSEHVDLMQDREIYIRWRRSVTKSLLLGVSKMS